VRQLLPALPKLLSALLPDFFLPSGWIISEAKKWSAFRNVKLHSTLNISKDKNGVLEAIAFKLLIQRI